MDTRSASRIARRSSTRAPLAITAGDGVRRYAGSSGQALRRGKWPPIYDARWRATVGQGSAGAVKAR